MGFKHRLKKTTFLGRPVVICLQNENGPCPLLSLCNALLLRGTISIHSDRSEITSEELVEMTANRLLESNPPHKDENLRVNQQHSIDDVIKLLPSLQQGLDVNLRFTHPKDYEYNTGICLFDMLDVNLYHGWIIDPSDEVTHSTIKDLSYNQLVDKVISSGEARKSQTELQTQGLICRAFMEDTASQLTYYGLVELHTAVREREIAVFFRNNHFSTLFKIEGELYMLVTDQGYQYQDAVAWEKLTEIDGNTEMVSPDFGDPNQYIPAEDLAGEADDQDRQLAMQLQREEEERAQQQRSQSRARVPTTRASATPRERKPDKGNCVVS